MDGVNWESWAGKCARVAAALAKLGRGAWHPGRPPGSNCEALVRRAKRQAGPSGGSRGQLGPRGDMGERRERINACLT